MFSATGREKSTISCSIVEIWDRRDVRFHRRTSTPSMRISPSSAS
jgi:hypothetical protein